MSKEIENHSQMSKNTGLSCETFFLEVEEEAGSWNEWRGSLWAPQACPPPPGVVVAGLVAHWSGPQASSQAQKFSKIPDKIILNFQDHRRTFIFEVFFSGALKQKT